MSETFLMFKVDAFADRVFAGNPAAVVPMPGWLDDATLMRIAAENAVSETAFLMPHGDEFAIRWFAPRAEVDLCGHGTLAAAFVVTTMLQPARRTVTFQTRRVGPLTVEREDDLFALDLPARPPQPVTAPPGLTAALGGPEPVAVLEADRYLVVYANESDVRELAPDMAALARLDRPVCVTAPGTDTDVVCRYFAPSRGVPEDPVTGAAHCVLVPYWAARFGRPDIRSHQVSARGGVLDCVLDGGRVRLKGRAKLYLEGVIHV